MTAVSGTAPGFRTLQRQLAALVPDAPVLAAAAESASLEAQVTRTEVPRLIGAKVLEDSALKSRTVDGEPHVGFAAFLDGTQASRVLQHANGIPLIVGTVAAVVRVRHERRLSTWRHSATARLYAPRRLLDRPWNAAIDALEIECVDLSAEDGELIAHPYAVRDAAVHRVQRDREEAEYALSTAWCDEMTESLFVDGGLSGNERVASSPIAVGVVKSHRTLYAEGDGLRVVLGLQVGERSSVFRITSPRRTAVASWYLRLRDAIDRDPMWGLVRVEVTEPASTRDLTNRADEVSRWILAERTPIAAPDSRWDTMVYGIRDCEEFLKATAQR